MRNKLILLVFICMSVLSCSKDKDLDSTDTNTKNASYEQKIMNLINDYRISKGKNKLASSDLIKKHTLDHTNYMIGKKDISHDNDKVRYADINKTLGTSGASENVAYNSSTDPKEVFNQWKNSTKHNINMLRDAKYFYVSAKKASDGTWYYTAIFS